MRHAVRCESAPFVRTVRCRTVAKTLLIGSVIGMRGPGSTFQPPVFVLAAYAASIRDRGSGSTKVRAGRRVR